MASWPVSELLNTDEIEELVLPHKEFCEVGAATTRPSQALQHKPLGRQLRTPSEKNAWLPMHLSLSQHSLNTKSASHTLDQRARPNDLPAQGPSTAAAPATPPGRMSPTFVRMLSRVWKSWSSDITHPGPNARPFFPSEKDHVRADPTTRRATGGRRLFVMGSSFKGIKSDSNRVIALQGLELKEQVGEGVCGQVFRALFHGNEVAVKVLKKTEKYEAEGTCPIDARECLEREMNALEQCVHPNIVALLERQELESGRPVMVLELLKCTLEQYFDNHKSFITGNTFKAPVKYVEKWSYELAQALQFIHGHAPKIIHRDIKPHNVMLDFDLNCKLADFGLCKVITREIRSPDHETDGYMMTGHTGTYGYMAPEVGVDALDPDGMCRYNESADVFSYGMVVHFMCTGTRPLHWLRSMVALDMLKKGARPSMEQIAAKYPDWVVLLLAKCWSHHPQDRPTGEQSLKLKI